MQLVNLHIAATCFPVRYFSLVIGKAKSINMKLYRAGTAHYLKGEPHEYVGRVGQSV